MVRIQGNQSCEAFCVGRLSIAIDVVVLFFILGGQLEESYSQSVCFSIEVCITKPLSWAQMLHKGSHCHLRFFKPEPKAVTLVSFART